MEKYIKTYDNVLTKDQCNQIIQKFELSTDQHIKTEYADTRWFTEININHHKDWEGFTLGIIDILKKSIEKYIVDCNLTYNQWPTKYGFENIRIKRYLPNDKDEFRSHVDVGDYKSARRFLVMFLYLDDNEAGETGFDEYGIKVKPEPGRLLMFPPTWTYLHTGHKPVKKPKYIIGSYLHYL
jgi:hypothetical protein